MEIINRVAQSTLNVFDLEDLYQEGPRTNIDLAQWLYEGFVLREKEFRASLQEQDWSNYKNTFVALHCSTDAIVPAWAFMLVAAHVQPFAKRVFWGTPHALEVALFTEALSTLSFESYQDSAVIIKGCSKKPVPQEAYVEAIQKLQPFAKSIMYGEACSAVPLFKRKKS